MVFGVGFRLPEECVRMETLNYIKLLPSFFLLLSEVNPTPYTPNIATELPVGLCFCTEG